MWSAHDGSTPPGTLRNRSKSSHTCRWRTGTPRRLSSSATKWTVRNSRRLPRWTGPDGEAPDEHVIVSPSRRAAGRRRRRGSPSRSGGPAGLVPWWAAPALVGGIGRGHATRARDGERRRTPASPAPRRRAARPHPPRWVEAAAHGPATRRAPSLGTDRTVPTERRAAGTMMPRMRAAAPLGHVRPRLHQAGRARLPAAAGRSRAASWCPSPTRCSARRSSCCATSSRWSTSASSGSRSRASTSPRRRGGRAAARARPPTPPALATPAAGRRPGDPAPGRTGGAAEAGRGARRAAARRRDQLRRQPGPAAARPHHRERRRPAVAATRPVRLPREDAMAAVVGEAGPAGPRLPRDLPGPGLDGGTGRRWSCAPRSASRSGCCPSCRPGCSSSAPPTSCSPSRWASSTSRARWSGSRGWCRP